MFSNNTPFSDGNWRQTEALIVLLAGAIEVNALDFCEFTTNDKSILDVKTM